jgi:hypothetical protein
MDDDNHYFKMSRTDQYGRSYAYNDAGLREVRGIIADPSGQTGKIRTENGLLDYMVVRGRLVITG